MTAADQLVADLGAALTGDLARFAPGLAGPSDPRAAIAADALLDAAMVEAIVARFEGKFGRSDRRAILSIWSSLYFADALPPLLAANLMLDREPDCGLDGVRFIVAPNFRITALVVGASVRTLGDVDAVTRFDGVRAHLTAFIDLVADRTGVTRRLLWSNAGNVFDAFTRHLRDLAAVPALPDPAGELMGRRVLPGGDRNPLFSPVTYDEGRRVRRVCCLRYLVPNRGLCGVCPMPPDHPVRTSQVSTDTRGQK